MSSPPFLLFEQLSYQLSPDSAPILTIPHLEIKEGEFLLLLGSNGSGKSSLIKTINGMIHPSSGTIFYKGKRLKSVPLHQRAKSIATIDQELNRSTFSSLTVLENCIIALHRNRKTSLSHISQKEKETIKDRLFEYHPSLPSKLHETADSLSGGEKQSLALAMSLWNSPELLLLDEHTSALDPRRAEELMGLTHKKIQFHQTTTLMVTHNLEHALRYGDRLLIMKEGKIEHDIREKKTLTRNFLLSLYTD